MCRAPRADAERGCADAERARADAAAKARDTLMRAVEAIIMERVSRETKQVNDPAEKRARDCFVRLVKHIHPVHDGCALAGQSGCSHAVLQIALSVQQDKSSNCPELKPLYDKLFNHVHSKLAK